MDCETSGLVDYNLGLSSSILDLKSVSDKTADLLRSVICDDITVADILLYFPIFYKTSLSLPSLSGIPRGSHIALKVSITGHLPGGRYNKTFGKSGVYQIFAEALDGQPITLLFFKIFQSQIRQFAVGTTHTIDGKLEESMGQYRIVHPKIYQKPIYGIEVFGMAANATNSSLTAFNIDSASLLNPIYKVPKTVNQDEVVGLVKASLLVAQTTRLSCVDCRLDNGSSMSFFDVLKSIHFPQSTGDLELLPIMKRCLALQEIVATKLALHKARKSVKLAKKEPIFYSGRIIEEVKSRLSFSLTDEQETVVAEILNDQASDEKMFRMLQGDVGSGKTIVALIAMLNVVESGKKAILMAPTTILAFQHFRLISDLLFGINVNIVLLTGKITTKKRRELMVDLNSGNVDIVVGTHALVQEKNNVSGFHLCVVDEQHRFGVKQRSALLQQNPDADVLMVTATPIPRTMLMMLYGDIKVSVIKSKPPGRSDVETRVISDSKCEELLMSTKRQVLGNGAKVYWVCPLIDNVNEDGVNDTSVSSVMNRVKSLEKLLGSDNVLVLHGKMKESEKDDVMIRFSSKKGCVLVSTTVVEVGVNVPDATIMIIESAERFGLSQLHQLRGRVGRGNEKSFCILMYSTSSGPGKLSILRDSADGFYIAEQDLKIRGAGDIVGTRQSGYHSFKISSVEISSDLFRMASDIVDQILSNPSDPILSDTADAILLLFAYSEETNSCLRS